MRDISSPAVSSRRILLIDFLRGLCLVLMTVDHLPYSPLEKFTWQPFGFISAAEGFVFLSGLVIGNVYGRTAVSQGILMATGRTFRRLRTIYITNSAFITVAMLAASRGYASLGDGVRPSWHLWQGSIVLFLAPSYAEILRLYCIFFVFVPLILWALVKGHMRAVMMISGLLWLLAKMGYGTAALPNSGYFDLISWQLLFVVGICLGFRPLTNQSGNNIAWVNGLLTITSVIVVITFFAIRHERFLTGVSFSPYWSWLSTWRRTLSVARLIDFSAFAFLIFRFRGSLGPLLRTRPGKAFAYLGRHSLPVFIWSVSASMLTFAGRIDRKWLAAKPLVQMICAIIVLASCFVPAWLHSQWQRLPKSMWLQEAAHPGWLHPTQT